MNDDQWMMAGTWRQWCEQGRSGVEQEGSSMECGGSGMEQEGYGMECGGCSMDVLYGK